MDGIRTRKIAETSFAVIDFETTGLRAGTDRVVEVSVVQMDPQQPPRLVLDTLVNPKRKMAATEVHGISDADVSDAPTFKDIAVEIADAVAGAVIASYNIYFDMPFFRYELSAAGLSGEAPHVCVMYLRPMVGMGNRCCLDDACSCHGIQRSVSHMASADAMDAAKLLAMGIQATTSQEIHSFDDLSRRQSYKFTTSFDLPPLAACGKDRSPCRTKSRITAPAGAAPVPVTVIKNPVAVYWEALGSVLSDLLITEEEIESLTRKKQECDLSGEQVRALHARAFAHVINQFVDDRQLDAQECRKLNRLYECLGKLGWAPGQAN